MRLFEIDDFRRLARHRLPRMVADFVDGGADAEWTLKANRRSFDDVMLRPRQLVDVSQRDQSVSVFGDKLALPVLLGPEGLARLVHPEGELAAARRCCWWNGIRSGHCVIVFPRKHRGRG